MIVVVNLLNSVADYDHTVMYFAFTVVFFSNWFVTESFNLNPFIATTLPLCITG